MEKEKVPQDDANIFGGKSRMLKYAVDENGRYTKVPSAGWEPENIVLEQAWTDINEKAEAVRKKIAEGALSPIAFYMEQKMFTVKMLSDYIGIVSFRIRRHLKPKHFKKLPQEMLQKYADIFQISVEELINFQ